MEEYYVCTCHNVDYFMPWDVKENFFGWTPEDVYPWFKMMIDDGTARSFFGVMDQKKVTFGFFFNLFHTGVILPFFGKRGEEPVVFYMLDDIQFATARVHFVFSKKTFGREALRIAYHSMGWLLNMRHPDGRPVFKALMGETMASNRLAWKFAQKVGFTPYGVIKEGFYNDNDKVYVDKLLSCLTSETLVKHE